MVDAKEAVKCPYCELTQFRNTSPRCRRCLKPLPQGVVESTTVILVGRIKAPKIVPIDELMQQAVVDAVRITGRTGEAARLLGITKPMLKKILRAAGDETDYRCKPKEAKG
jgi:hypothetical protein